jgi:hypothetical protein
VSGLSAFILTASLFFGLFWPAMFLLCWRDARVRARETMEAPAPLDPPLRFSEIEIPPPERRLGIGFWVGFVPATATYVLFCLVIAVFFWPCFLAGKRRPPTTTAANV